MSTVEEIPADMPRKRSKLPLVAGVVLAAMGGGGGFFAVTSGLVPGAGGDAAAGESVREDAARPLPDVAFVAVEPMVVSLRDGTARHLRFRAQLEVPTPHEAEVAAIMPRIVDVLNGYLQALEMEELQDRATLSRLRAQMLRRVQIVTGKGRVRDLLVLEFVLN